MEEGCSHSLVSFPTNTNKLVGSVSVLGKKLETRSQLLLRQGGPNHSLTVYHSHISSISRNHDLGFVSSPNLAQKFGCIASQEYTTQLGKLAKGNLGHHACPEHLSCKVQAAAFPHEVKTYYSPSSVEKILEDTHDQTQEIVDRLKQRRDPVTVVAAPMMDHAPS